MDFEVIEVGIFKVGVLALGAMVDRSAGRGVPYEGKGMVGTGADFSHLVVSILWGYLMGYEIRL